MMGRTPHATPRVKSKTMSISREMTETKEPWSQPLMDTPAEESEVVRIRQTQVIQKSV